ncbi:MAG: DUF4418 family protein [Planctomycetota bacterium]|nr:DUF4418 family protein [Planctomycetota bacterium]
MKASSWKRSLAASLPVAAPGLLLAAIPFRLFPVCPVPHGAAPMRCYWSGSVLEGFGAAFFLVGVMLFFARSSDMRRGMCAAAVLLAVTAGMVPTHLVGLCASPAMPCRIGTFPAVMVALALIVMGSLFVIFYLGYIDARERRSHEAAHDIPNRQEQS